MITFIAKLTWQLANFNPKFLFPSLLFAKREHQEKWCEAYKGQVEVALPDACFILPPTSNLTHLSLRLTPDAFVLLNPIPSIPLFPPLFSFYSAFRVRLLVPFSVPEKNLKTKGIIPNCSLKG
jgi:hypothetical protein